MARTPEGPWRRSDRPGWWCKLDGRKIRLDVDDKASKTDARRVWSELVTEKPKPVALGSTLKSILEGYLADRANSKEMCRRVSHFGVKFIAFVGVDTAPADVIPNHLTRWLAEQTTWGGTNRRNAVGAVKRLFNWAKSEGLIEASPIASARMPKQDKRVFVFTPEQTMLAITAARGRFQAFVAALAASGARPSELARAKKEDATPDGSMIYLPTGKQGARSIYFPVHMAAWLKAQRDAAKPGGPLFPNRFGNHWRPEAWGQCWSRLRAAADLPQEGTCYTFRHTWITRMVQTGTPLAIIAKAAGTSIKMISDHYSHLQPADVEAWRRLF